MKITLTKVIAGPAGTWMPGTEIELDDDFAKALIAAHAATGEIEIPEAAPEPETAVIKTKRGNRK